MLPLLCVGRLASATDRLGKYGDVLKGLPKNKRWALSVWTGQHMYRRWVFIEGRIGGREKSAGGHPALYGRSPSVWVGGGIRPLPGALPLPIIAPMIDPSPLPTDRSRPMDRLPLEMIPCPIAPG